MDAQLSLAGFQDSVDSWVQKALDSGASNLSDLLGQLPGVYPAEVLAAVARLRSNGSVSADRADNMLARARYQSAPRAARHDCEPSLPAPHPLDYEWRFARSAVRRLLSQCHGATGCGGGRVALLGAPSIAMQAPALGYEMPLLVVDQNDEIISLLRSRRPAIAICRCDILRDDFATSETARAIIADPPWYPEHIRAFLWAAGALSIIGGAVFVSLPPIGTRPGILDERKELFSWAEMLGLQSVGVEPAALPYVTPLFERNSLRAARIADVPPVWRRGDLAAFRRVGDPVIQRPAFPQTADAVGKWSEERVGRVRLRLKISDAAAFADPSLQTLVAGDVLPTVSRRDPRRGLADVWTSGNRIFRCHSTGILRSIIQAVKLRRSPADAVETGIGRLLIGNEAELVAHATRQVLQLLEVERNEHSAYSEDGDDVEPPAIAV